MQERAHYGSQGSNLFERFESERRRAMLAWRTAWIVKPRCMEKALEFFETEVQRGLPENGMFRVYTPGYSPDVLVFEETWESEKEHDQYWADLNAASESAAMWDRWYAIVERSTGTELWNLREWKTG